MAFGCAPDSEVSASFADGHPSAFGLKLFGVEMNLNTQNLIASIAATQRVLHEAISRIDGSTTVDHQQVPQDHVQVLLERAHQTEENLKNLMHALGGLRGEAADEMSKQGEKNAHVLHFRQIGWRLIASGLTDVALDEKIDHYKKMAEKNTFSDRDLEVLESLEAEKRVRL